VTEIGAALLELAGARLQPGAEHQQDATPGPPEWIDIENRMCVRDSDMDDVEKIGTPSSLTCPECNGALWEIHRKVPTRYRCHTGHAFTARVLEALQSNAVEDAIWGAVRALHEQERLFGKLSEKELQSGHREEAMEHQAKATRARAHSQALRELIATRAPIGLDETS
jgi:two-component system chemotaxis response regulator CheB